MKNIFFLVLFMLSTVGFSQTKFGVRAGVNQSNITGSDFSVKTDFYVGALLNIHISELYELQPEVTYSRQGGKNGVIGDAYDSYTGIYTRDKSDVELNYLSIGATNKFYILKDEKLHFLVGPSLNFNFKYNMVNLTNGGVDDVEYTPIDLSFYGGVGYQFDMGLTIEARYKQGLIDVNLDDTYNYTAGSYDNTIERNSVFQIGLSYKFDFSKKED